MDGSDGDGLMAAVKDMTATLREGLENGSTWVAVTQQLSTALSGSSRIRAIEMAASAVGLDVSVESVGNWWHSAHLFTFEGETHKMLRFYEWLETV